MAENRAFQNGRHSLGKGEAVSSNLTCGTTFSLENSQLPRRFGAAAMYRQEPERTGNDRQDSCKIRGVCSALVLALLLVGCAGVPGESPVMRAWYSENPATWRAESPARMLVWDASRTDCVGFVLRWRERLIAAGYKPESLTIANFHTPLGWHAALLVRDGGKVWKLDNMERGPVEWKAPDSWAERDPSGRIVVLHSARFGRVALAGAR